MSDHWSKCPKCGKTRLDNGRPVVIVATMKRVTIDVGKSYVPSYMKCRACGHRWSTLRPD